MILLLSLFINTVQSSSGSLKNGITHTGVQVFLGKERAFVEISHNQSVIRIKSPQYRGVLATLKKGEFKDIVYDHTFIKFKALINGKVVWFVTPIITLFIFPEEGDDKALYWWIGEYPWGSVTTYLKNDINPL